MKDIFRINHAEMSVFKDETILYPDYLPEKLPGRQKEIEEIASCLRPLLFGKMPRNMFLYGSTGVGKTACVKFVLKKLTEEVERRYYEIKSFYINCFQINTKYSIFTEISNYMGFTTPRRGLSCDEVYATIKEAIRKVKFYPIITLDEFDKVLNKQDASEVLYNLSRITDSDKKFCLIIISNDESLISRLDDRARSSLMPIVIKFENYGQKELKEILVERSNLAFKENCIEYEAIALAAAKAAKLGGDARVAINAILEAGRIADHENSSKVKIDHVKKAFEKTEFVSKLKALKYLGQKEKNVLKIISSKDGITSGEVYEILDKMDIKMSERSKRYALEKLEKLGLIKTTKLQLGNKGKTRRIYVNFEKEALEKYL
ncbi:MAG: AAA family ATPase [Candidatus Diapherotrites archaeon]|nr:AAA family ATPase [Candidatus Diapherotrites archaeon]